MVSSALLFQKTQLDSQSIRHYKPPAFSHSILILITDFYECLSRLRKPISISVF